MPVFGKGTLDASPRKDWSGIPIRGRVRVAALVPNFMECS